MKEDCKFTALPNTLRKFIVSFYLLVCFSGLGILEQRWVVYEITRTAWSRQINTNPLAFSTAEVFTWTNLTSDRMVFHTSVSDSRFTISYNRKMSFGCHVVSATSAATWWAPPFPLTTHHSPEVLCWHGDVIINIAGNFLGVGAKRGSNIMPTGQAKHDPPTPFLKFI